MNPEKQRIAIAETCGWKFNDAVEPYAEKIGLTNIHLVLCAGPDGLLDMVEHKPWPDYLNDLNAMHEAEKTLLSAQLPVFVFLLQKMYGDGTGRGFNGFISATASQRAEAFLKTIGKWEEEQ